VRERFLLTHCDATDPADEPVSPGAQGTRGAENRGVTPDVLTISPPRPFCAPSRRGPAHRAAERRLWAHCAKAHAAGTRRRTGTLRKT